MEDSADYSCGNFDPAGADFERRNDDKKIASDTLRPDDESDQGTSTTIAPRSKWENLDNEGKLGIGFM